MNTVGKILKAKGSTVWTVSKDAPVSEALKLFVEKRISSVIAMDGEKVAGIFTERDFAHKVGLFGKDPAVVKYYVAYYEDEDHTGLSCLSTD
jgi:CBS domain-containing protein